MKKKKSLDQNIKLHKIFIGYKEIGSGGKAYLLKGRCKLYKRTEKPESLRN